MNWIRMDVFEFEFGIPIIHDRANGERHETPQQLKPTTTKNKLNDRQPQQQYPLRIERERCWKKRSCPVEYRTPWSPSSSSLSFWAVLRHRHHHHHRHGTRRSDGKENSEGPTVALVTLMSMNTSTTNNGNGH